MSSFGNACRLSARIASSQLRNNVTSRGFRTASANFAAHNFAMPAMSPTMTEGNISSWKVKEGDSFTAGDILLEIETDKAQMEVEAQDDGVMAKIMQGDGSKAVKVGTRIAVLADPGDDISSLEIAAEESPRETKSEPAQSAKQPYRPAAEAANNTAQKPGDIGNMASSAGQAKKQKYPLYPSVQALFHEAGLSTEDANKIPATGPNGRLLKGDVLAYLGRIEKSYSANQSQRIEKLGKLDLSNIKIAEQSAAPPKKEARPTETAPAEKPTTSLSLPVSLTAVLALQARLSSTLGINMPTATLISRAVELANDALPESKTHKPTSDELFNSVLGVKSSPRASTGAFAPQITPLALTQLPSRPAVSRSKKKDIFDEILGVKSAKKSTSSPKTAGKKELLGSRATEPVNVFSVSAPKGDEKRAMVFLERVKSVLESEPGRLVV